MWSRVSCVGALAALAGAFGCSGDGGGEPVSSKIDQVISQEVPTIPLAAGEEQNDTCFSWTLDNEEPLYVNTVRMTGTPGIHHSNWFYVTGDRYEGPDGIWSCRSRDFDTVGSAGSGGVLFAQSTQAIDETQQFPAGNALMLPPGARIVADLHLLNTIGEDTDVEIDLELQTLAEEDVTQVLHALAVDYPTIDIPPRSVSQFITECSMDSRHRAALGRPLDFEIKYVLPHYHDLGTMLRLEVVGGDRDGEVIWETNSSIGEPLGGQLETPFDLTGADGVRLTCEYDNPRDESVQYGVGDQEMCVAFAFTDSEKVWGATTLGHEPELIEDGDIKKYDAGCLAIAADPPAE
ncbi:MAG: hypothetical protein ACOCUS_00230 [Polyangiales bacterium]